MTVIQATLRLLNTLPTLATTVDTFEIKYRPLVIEWTLLTVPTALLVDAEALKNIVTTAVPFEPNVLQTPLGNTLPGTETLVKLLH